MNSTYLLGGMLLAAWVTSSIIWPYTSCLGCDGNPRLRNTSGRSWRDCPACKGSGRRRRFLAMFLTGARPGRR